MKFTKPGILSKILLIYSVALAIILFPFAAKHSSWGVYIPIVSLAFILTFLMFWISKKQEKQE